MKKRGGEKERNKTGKLAKKGQSCEETLSITFSETCSELKQRRLKEWKKNHGELVQ